MKKILICGDVDSGKSTLIGKLLKDAKANLYKDIKDNELHYITDTLSFEKVGNKTVHSSQYYLSEDILLINCPGHKEYIKDTISRMSEADVGILVKNKNTYNSKLTSLYEDMLNMFNIPYISLYNVSNNNFSTEDISDFTLDIVNDNLTHMLKAILSLSKKNIDYNSKTNMMNTILFNKYEHGVISNRNITCDIKLKKTLYTNDILSKYVVNLYMESGCRIVFYNDKKIVGCGVYE